MGRDALVSFVLAVLAGLGLAGSAVGQESSITTLSGTCGSEPVSIARMQWPSAAILAYVHATIVDTELGCDTSVVSGDLSATASSMATTGQPLVAPEMWIGRVAEIWNSALESQAVRPGGQSFSGSALEGWFVPDSLIETVPELTSVAAIEAHIEAFQPEGGGKPHFISCPVDWACSIINRNLLAAHGLSGRFELVEPANRFEMDSLIGSAMSRNEPVLFYYWQPNAVLAQFDFTGLDGGAYDAEAMACLAQRDCTDPQPSSFVPEPVVIALAESVFSDLPRIAAYFQRASMPLETMNALLAWQNEQQASAEETAAHFIEAYPAIWRNWVGR